MESWLRMETLEGFKEMLGKLDIGQGRESEVEKRTIIYFSAEWCTPCKKLAPLLDKVVKKYAEDISFVKVDADVEKSLAAFYNIQSVPTFVLLKTVSDWEITPVTVNPQFLEDYFYKAVIKK
jgi:thiol-disulfide isomerase/thioredoxin